MGSPSTYICWLAFDVTHTPVLLPLTRHSRIGASYVVQNSSTTVHSARCLPYGTYEGIRQRPSERTTYGFGTNFRGFLELKGFMLRRSSKKTTRSSARKRGIVYRPYRWLRCSTVLINHPGNVGWLLNSFDEFAELAVVRPSFFYWGRIEIGTPVRRVSRQNAL